MAKAAGFVAERTPFALIVSLEIEGGAAREVGSLALVDASGEMTGYLSKGCIDQDIRHHALTAIAPVLHADPVHLTSPNNNQPLEALDAYSTFLTLFHDHDWEPTLLKAALDTPAHFIGCLGSQRTHTLRKENLRQMGVSEASLERLRGPIGLVPSMRDASFITVSTLVEIVAAFQ